MPMVTMAYSNVALNKLYWKINLNDKLKLWFNKLLQAYTA